MPSARALTLPARASYLPDVVAQISERLDAAEVVAREAAAILVSFKSAPDVVAKGVGDLVTAADRASERHIIARLAALFPGDAIVGEEGGVVSQAGADWLWYIDPLDGTTNFVHGLPHYCVSIGAVFLGRPAVGVVVAPDLQMCTWRAGRGLGATRDGRPIRVRDTARLDQALVATGFPYDRSLHAAELARPLAKAIERCLDVRRIGSAALDLALVADGTFPIFWEARLKPWDIAAGVVIVREAGGRVTDHAGGDDYLASGDILATNSLLHDAFLHDVLAR